MRGVGSFVLCIVDALARVIDAADLAVELLDIDLVAEAVDGLSLLRRLGAVDDLELGLETLEHAAHSAMARGFEWCRDQRGLRDQRDTGGSSTARRDQRFPSQSPPAPASMQMSTPVPTYPESCIAGTPRRSIWV